MDVEEYWTHRVLVISVPRFAIWLIPVHHPISADMWRSVNERAPIWTSDGDTPNLNWRAHPCVDGTPALRDVGEHSPILPLSIRTTIPSGPNGLPESALRNPIFPSLLPQLSIAPHALPLPFRPPYLSRHGGLRIRDRSRQGVGDDNDSPE